MKICTKNKSELKEIKDMLPNYLEEKTIPTNIFILDYILKGGINTNGSSIQFLADSGVGKTTTMLQLSHNICEQGKNVVYIDTESSLTKELLQSTCVTEYLDTNFFYIKESSYDKVEKYLDMYLDIGEISVVIVGSLAGLINSGFTNLKGGISITTNNTMYGSRPLTMFMNKYKALASEKSFCFILVNQYRNRVDMRQGSILKEYGAKIVKYNSDTIIKLSTSISSKNRQFKNLVKPDDKGIDLELEIIKSNKTCPKQIFPAYLIYGKGISNLANYIYALLNMNVIERNGSYYSINELNIKSQGIQKFYQDIINSEVDIGLYFKDKIVEYYEKINENN